MKQLWSNQLGRDQWVSSVAARLPNGTKILDLGAGECRYKHLFSHCNYKTQDFASYMGTQDGLLKGSWTYGQIDYVCDATSIPVPNDNFDAVLCTEVLEHVPEPILVLKEIARILKPGGYAFITAPLGSGLHQQPYHFYGGYTPHFYRKFLGDFDCDIVSIEPNRHFFALLLQEIRRGAKILVKSKRCYRLNPLHWMLFFFYLRPVANWVLHLDTKIPIEEFTVGYHVVAVKRRSP